MAQQVAVVDGAQPEVLEAPVGVLVDGEVELAGVVLDEGGGLVADEPLGVPEGDGLAEGRDALPAHLLLDVAGEQPRGEPRVLRLLADQLGGGLDGQPVELGGGGAVVQAADGAGGDPHGVDVRQVAADAVDGADDLRHVDRFAVAVALADGHRVTGGGRGERHLFSSRDSRTMRSGGRAGGRPAGVRRPAASGVALLPSGGRPTRPRTTHTRAGVGRWQVFGLVGPPPRSPEVAPTGRRFPGPPGPVLMTAVVPTHRCGDSPGLPPGSLLPPRDGLPRGTSNTITICGGRPR